MGRRAGLACFLALACLSPRASAAEPKAVLKGPTLAQVESEFWLKFAGTVSDEPVELALAEGPEPVSPALLYSQDGVPIYGLCSVSRPGRYTFVVVATCAVAPVPPVPPPPGPAPPEPPKTFAPRFKRAYAFWTVVIPDPQPVPPPGPPPSPVPGPQPAPVPPDPAPAPVPPPPPPPTPAATKIYAVAVYPDGVVEPDTLAFLSVRDDPTLTPSLSALNVAWRAMPASDPRVDALKIRPHLRDASFGPQLLVYDAAGKVYDAAGNPQSQSTAGGAFRAPASVAELVAYFKKIRGSR